MSQKEPKKQVVKLIVDHRETPSGLVDVLTDYTYSTTTVVVSTEVEVDALPVGDIICSDRVAVERKEASDFVSTFVDSGRDLFTQAFDMLRAYPHSVMCLEGGSIQGIRGVHPEALRAAVCGLTVGMRLPIIPTENVAHTAAQAVTIARREQFPQKRSISLHGKRSTMSPQQRRIYVVSSIGDGVGPAAAKALIEEFRTVQAVMTASEDELTRVKGIGKLMAKKIRELVGE